MLSGTYYFDTLGQEVQDITQAQFMKEDGTWFYVVTNISNVNGVTNKSHRPVPTNFEWVTTRIFGHDQSPEKMLWTINWY